MKIQFQGTADPDDIADAFILSFLASRKGSPVSAEQVWKSLHSKGFVPTDGRPTAAEHPDEGAAIAEIGQRLQLWRDQGLVGGEVEPESITGLRHFWVIGSSRPRG
jgi:pentatricopeptide repeat protein